MRATENWVSFQCATYSFIPVDCVDAAAVRIQLTNQSKALDESAVRVDMFYCAGVSKHCETLCR